MICHFDMNKQLSVVTLRSLTSVMVFVMLLTGCSGSESEEGGLSESESDKGPALNNTWIRPTDGTIMVFVPEGSFLLGSNENQIETA